jgi:hypothetical protein
LLYSVLLALSVLNDHSGSRLAWRLFHFFRTSQIVFDGINPRAIAFGADVTEMELLRGMVELVKRGMAMQCQLEQPISE